MKNSDMNAERFKGFSDIYDSARPKVPDYPVEVITKYLGRKPETVVDLGCGTGLSSVVWIGNADRIIGVEPSDDMRSVALKRDESSLEFIKGFGNATGLKDDSADVAVCSQSFHWMEPESTLKEVNKILKDGGVFATVDCDWPPVMDWKAEKSYMTLYGKVKEIEKSFADVADTFVRYPKNRHLENIKNSGYFRYVREIVFENKEKATAERLINLIKSQGSLQVVKKLHSELIADDIEKFEDEVKTILPTGEFEIGFSYRMRIAVK